VITDEGDDDDLDHDDVRLCLLNYIMATGKLYHFRLRVECTLFCNLQSWARTHAVLVIGLYELLNPMT
jgi:hypothetical protein